MLRILACCYDLLGVTFLTLHQGEKGNFPSYLFRFQMQWFVMQTYPCHCVPPLTPSLLGTKIDYLYLVFLKNLCILPTLCCSLGVWGFGVPSPI